MKQDRMIYSLGQLTSHKPHGCLELRVYVLQLEAKSYASRNQLAVSQKEIDAASELEWDRHYFTVLGVANKRLYEFRLQTAKDTYDKAKVVTFLRIL